MDGNEGEMTSRLVLLASKFAESTPGFFDIKGPGKGDRATNEFMGDLRQHAREMLGKDYSEARICTGTDFTVDFFFPEEQTAVEFAFSLDKPLNEYERDIFKCLLAIESGYSIRKLVLVCKPGGESRTSAPGPKAIRRWVARNHGLEVNVFELHPHDSVRGGGRASRMNVRSQR
jgi:hypothetical protein